MITHLWTETEIMNDTGYSLGLCLFNHPITMGCSPAAMTSGFSSICPMLDVIN